MPGDPHPISLVYGPGNVEKADVIGDTKFYTRRVVPDPDHVRATDYTGQFGGLYIRSLNASFRLDTGSIGADDGVNEVIDAAGNHFVKVIDSATLVQRVHTVAGAVTVSADDVDIIVVKKSVGAATTVNLPSAAVRTKPVRIVDGKYDAAANNITIDADGSETIMGALTYIIDSNGASILLTPLADGTGWV